MGDCKTKALICSSKSGVDVWVELLVPGEGAVRMVKGRQGAIVEQCGAGSDSFGPKTVSQAATSSSRVCSVVFGGTPVFQFIDVDAGAIFVGEDAGVIWSVMVRAEAPNRAMRVNLRECRAVTYQSFVWLTAGDSLQAILDVHAAPHDSEVYFLFGH